MWWVLTVYFGATAMQPTIQKVTLYSYSRYEDCAYAAAREDTQPSVMLADNRGTVLKRLGLAQCIPTKK